MISKFEHEHGEASPNGGCRTAAGMWRVCRWVWVLDEQAKMTYKATIGSVDKKKQVNILISRGLDESEGADVIVRGLLK